MARMAQTDLPFDEPSIFTPKDILEEVMRRRGIRHEDVPPVCLIAYSQKILNLAREHFNYRFKEHDIGTSIPVPIYFFSPLKCPPFGIIVPQPGDANAAIVVEELSYMGFQDFLSTGTMGHPTALEIPELQIGGLALVRQALSYEGTSRHYTPKTILAPDVTLTDTLKKLLQEDSIHFVEGTIATTSGFYRETPSFIRQIIARGTIGVDMETSALFATAGYCKKRIASLLYISDFVKLHKDTAVWDMRFLDQKVQEAAEQVFGLACKVIDRIS